jgi:DNA-binding HxlR family transcriptional regulator
MTHPTRAIIALRVLQEKWVLPIVQVLLDGPKGFNAIGREVGGCNPSTLAARLARLEALGLIDKRDGAGEARSCYQLTDAGAQLESVIGAIARWADRHLDERRCYRAGCLRNPPAGHTACDDPPSEPPPA